MEKEEDRKERELREALQKLQKDLYRDLKRGHFYGLDQKIRNIQKIVALGIRI
jgi:hypothetical protein